MQKTKHIAVALHRSVSPQSCQWFTAEATRLHITSTLGPRHFSTWFHWQLTVVPQATEITREPHLLANCSPCLFHYYKKKKKKSGGCCPHTEMISFSAVVHKRLCLLQEGDVGVNWSLIGD